MVPPLFSSACPSAGSPTLASPRRTSPAARLSPSASPSRCAPGGSAGPWLLNACRPGSSAALPSPCGASSSRSSTLGDCVASLLPTAVLRSRTLTLLWPPTLERKECRGNRGGESGRRIIKGHSADNNSGRGRKCGKRN